MQDSRAFVQTALASTPLGLVAALLAIPDTASAEPTSIIGPSSPWNVNYADDSCRLGRTFGSGDDLVILVLDRFAPGQDFKMVLAGKRLKVSDYARVVSFRFGPNEAEQERPFFKGDLGKGRPALIIKGGVRFDGAESKPAGTTFVTPEPISDARIAMVSQLSVGKPLWKPMQLALGSMKKPVAELDKCASNLLVKWGVDPARHATLSRKVTPKTSPQKWLSDYDYPSSAAFRGAQGIVEFRLSIDESGVPTACHIQQSTRPPEFDKVVCEAMMKRARFDPALDKDGKPLASYFRSAVNFEMAR